MAGRIAGWLALVFVSAAFATAVAAPLVTAGDGCDSLRDVVVSQLRDYATVADGQTLLRQDKGVPQIPDPPEYCLHTAAVTTAAFGAAMHEAGIPVTWGPQTSRSGDYCLSHYLEQCYPRGEFGGAATASQLGFVHDSWRAVSKSVSAVMPYGVASDIAVFETGTLAGSMEQRLRGELASPDARSDKPKSRRDQR
jgi:hypothetical protein